MVRIPFARNARARGGHKSTRKILIRGLLALCVAVAPACGEGPGEGSNDEGAAESDLPETAGTSDSQETIVVGEPPDEQRDGAAGEEEKEEPASDETVVETEPEPEPLPVYGMEDTLRLNDLQMKGSHNSYHVSPEFESSPAWEYDMPAFNEQLGEYGVRSFELDIHRVDGELQVFHWWVDPGTKCPLLTDCLRDLRRWSQANPGHAPIIVWLELKFDGAGVSVANHLDQFERVLKDHWPREDVYTPDDLVGGYPDVQSALRAKGWPTLGEVRGKVIFVMMGDQDVQEKYAHMNTGLDGRRSFVSSGNTAWRHAGFIQFDDVMKLKNAIRGVAQRGLIVRTRADDIPTMGDPEDYPMQFRTALQSGAHMIMTDYPVPYRLDGYDTMIPGGTPVRCNPVTAPPECNAGEIEHPRLLPIEPE